MLNGLFGKVLGGFVAVILLAGMSVYFYALPSIEQQVFHSVERRVGQEAELLAELVKLSWDESTGQFRINGLQGLSERLSGSRLTLVAASGVVLFDSLEEVRSMDNHLERAEIQAPRRPVTRFSDTRRETMVYQACPVEIGDKVLAFARVAISTEDRRAQVSSLGRAIRSSAFLACLIALVVAFGIARLVSRPLTRISSYVGQLSKGGVGERLEVRGDDEFAQLARTVNTMGEEMEHQMELIRADKAEREAILSAMTDGLVAVDVDQKVLFINGAARELLQVQQEDPVGAPIWELQRTSGWNKILREVGFAQDSLAGARSSEGRLARADGELQLEVTAVAFADPGMSRAGTVLVLRDVTELRRLEGVRRDFVSNVGHELKTPMTAMRGFLEVVLGDPGLEPSHRTQFIQKALRNTEQLSEIVSDLLSLSRLESKDHGLRFETLELGTVLDAVAEDSRDLAESKRIHMEFCIPEDPLYVRADERALRMALANLVINAIRYSPEGTRVQVRAQSKPGDPAQAVIEVQDEGPGIPVAERERVFERFYRVDKVRTRKLGGTGLGLAIVRHVMSTHDGSVELESEPGQGCVFRLRLDEVPASEA